MFRMVPGNRLLFHTVRLALLVMGSALAFLFPILHHSPLSSEPLCEVASNESSAGGTFRCDVESRANHISAIHKFALAAWAVYPHSLPAPPLPSLRTTMSSQILLNLERQLLCSPAINEYDLFRRSYPYVIPM